MRKLNLINLYFRTTGSILLVVLYLILFSNIVIAAQDTYSFNTPIEQQRFAMLTSQLRCLVCQNQNIAESNAPLAADLREQIYQKIITQESDDSIIQYLIARYGDYILYRPPFNLMTIGLWLGPFLILIMAIGYLLFYLRQQLRE